MTSAENGTAQLLETYRGQLAGLTFFVNYVPFEAVSPALCGERLAA